jgi:hypothetical protein
MKRMCCAPGADPALIRPRMRGAQRRAEGGRAKLIPDSLRRGARVERPSVGAWFRRANQKRDGSRAGVSAA